MKRLIKRPTSAALVVAAGLALAGCGSSVGLGTAVGGGGMKTGSGSSARSSATKSSGSTSMAGMPGMTGMGGSSSAAAVPEVNGIKPVAYKAIATTYWQGMKIEAMTTTPTSFLIYNGDGKYGEIKANRHESFHLMVMLSDEHTGALIPYASVWATIHTAAGKLVYNDQQWPMISAYMGSHYGNNVTLPGPGRYTLKLLISPPEVARHLEYAHVWKTEHTVTEAFTWKPST
jgi:hypothetical protein